MGFNVYIGNVSLNYVGDTGVFAIAGHSPLLPLLLMSPARLVLSFAHSTAKEVSSSAVRQHQLLAAYAIALPSHSAISSPRLSNATSCVAVTTATVITIAIASVATTIRAPHSNRCSPWCSVQTPFFHLIAISHTSSPDQLPNLPPDLCT